MKTFNYLVGSSNNGLLLANPFHRVFHSGNHLFLCTNGWDVLEHLLYFGATKSLCSRTASYVPTSDNSVLSNCIYRIGSSVFHKPVFLKNLLNRLLITNFSNIQGAEKSTDSGSNRKYVIHDRRMSPLKNKKNGSKKHNRQRQFIDMTEVVKCTFKLKPCHFSLRGLISNLRVQTKFYSSLGGPN